MSFAAGFSPDGRWLISGMGPQWAVYHFWRVGTWDTDPDRRIDEERNGIASHPPAFTADGRLMALGIAPDQVRLADAATGRELARLTTLQPIIPTPLVFSPDGTKLIASTTRKTALVWDLRRIREEFARIGLDWDAPPYPVASAASRAPWPSPAAEAGAGRRRSDRDSGARAAELAEMNHRLAVNPDDAEALIHRGWLFFQERKWPAAIADLERRLRLQPNDADACWLLAEAYEGGGDLAGALAALSCRLERAPEDRDVRFRRGLLALAVARPDLARDDFTRILAAEPDLERRLSPGQASVRLRRHREALTDLDVLLAKDRERRRAVPVPAPQYHPRGPGRPRSGARRPREGRARSYPQTPETLDQRAWMLANGPIEQRDPESAVTLARRSVELAPGQYNSLGILGVALYRAGQCAEAVPVLEQGLAAEKGEFDAAELLLPGDGPPPAGAREPGPRLLRPGRAMVGRAQDLLAQAVAELTGFRAEAEAVLGLTRPIGELPAERVRPRAARPAVRDSAG